ncbi:MAG: hypothetical protein WC559_06405 [Candidatus Omnitrophota bacterium]
MSTHYRIDKNNRLVVKKGKKSVRPKGSFSIGPANTLIYLLNEPRPWRKEYDLPQRITLRGRWELNKNHDLVLRIKDPSFGQSSDSLVLNGEIISAGNDKLAFRISSVDKNGLSQVRILQFKGTWQADSLNRLTFSLTKRRSGILVFKNAWQLNNNQELTYIYRRREAAENTKSSSEITFSGHWQIVSANQLTYILSTGSSSRFDFKVQLETPNVYPQKGMIKYRIGIGARQKRLNRQNIVSLYGTWKIGRNLGLTFEMEYSRGKIYAMEFGAEIKFSENNRCIFTLKDSENKDLGARVVFTHKFLKQLDAELFLRLKYSQKEKRADIGLSFPF